MFTLRGPHLLAHRRLLQFVNGMGPSSSCRGARAGEVDWGRLEQTRRGQVIAHLTGCRPARRGIAETQLTDGVQAPALDKPVIQTSARVLIGRRHDGGGFSCTNIDDGQQIAHFIGAVAARVGVFEAELAIGIATPALERRVREHRASMAQTAEQGRREFARTQVDCRQVVAHFIGAVAANRRIALAKLPHVIGAPALDRGIIEEGAGKELAGRDGKRGFTRTEIDRQQVVTHIGGTAAAIQHIALAELSGLVRAPALDGGIVQQCAGRVVIRRNRDRGDFGTQVDDGQTITHGTHAVAVLHDMTLAEAPIGGITPALDRAVIQQCAGMRVSRRDLRRGFSGPQIHGRQVCAHFIGTVAAIVRVANAQLAIGVSTPALDDAARENRTHVPATDGHLRGRQTRTERNVRQIRVHFAQRITTIVGIALSELPAVVGAPALHATIVRNDARRVSIGRDGLYRRRNHAGEAVAGITRIASACARTGRIRTRCIGITSAVVDLAFVDVRARVTVAGIPAVAGASAIRTRRIGAAIRIRRTRRRRARAGAVAYARALIVGIRIGRDKRANAVVTAAFLRRRTSVTKAAAMVVAAEAVDAIRRQTLRRRRTRLAVVIAASARARTSSDEAFIVGIRVVLDRTAKPVGAALLLCRRARHTRAVAGRIAAEAVDTIHRSALRRRIASRTVGEVRRVGASARAIAIAVGAFIVGVGVRDDVAAGPVGSLAFFRRRASGAVAGTRVVTTNAVDAVARRALRCERAGRAVGLLGLRLIASARAAAFAGIAFIVGISAAGDVFAYAVITVTLFRIRAGFARAVADISAAEPVDAIIREALAGSRARCAVVITTNACTVTLAIAAFFVGVRLRRDVPADAIGAAALFGCRASHAIARARRIATNAVDAIARRTLPAGDTRRSVGLRRLGLIARSGSITFARIAFAFLIAPGAYRFANAVITVTLFPVRAGITELRADVAAAVAVDAIVGQTLRFVRTRHAVVILAHARAIACTGPALVVVVFVVRNESARAVRSAAFLGCGARHARPEAPAVTTHAVGAITRLALRSRRTRGAIGIRCLGARITRARTIAFAGIAFIVGIRRRFDGSTNAIIAAALFRRGARLTRAHADVSATDAVHAIVGQTLRRGNTRNPVVVLALVFPVTRAYGAIVIGIGVVSNGSANTVGARAFLCRAARHALVIAFRIAAKPVDTKTRRTLIVRRACRGRSRWRYQ